MKMLRYLTTLLILIYLNFCESKIVIQKCCPMHYNLNLKTNECILILNNKNHKDLINVLSNVSSETFTIAVSKSDRLNLPCKPPRIQAHSLPDNFNIFLSTVSQFCFDITVDYINVLLTCPCKQNTCVHVCCERGYMVDVDNGKECILAPEDWNSWKLEDNMANPERQYFSTMYGHKNYPPHCNQYVLDVPATVMDNGTLMFEDRDGSKYYESPEDYCIGVINDSDRIDIQALVCLPRDEETEAVKDAVVYCILFFIGAIFLLATLIVHIMLPELRRGVQGLSLMAHCASMFIAHIAIIIVKAQGHNMIDEACHFVAYIIQYFFLAGFFWLNVICIDISSKFRSLRSMVPIRSKELRKYSYYAAYAMGIPFIIFIITISVNSSTSSNERWHPGIGESYCFLNPNTVGMVLYFYGPVGLLILCNTFLFVFTAMRILAYKKDVSRSIVDKTSDRARFILFVKLFGLMGLPWATEIISWAVGHGEWYWIVADAFNILRSIFIFIIFCCKKKVLELLQNKYPRLIRPLLSTTHAVTANSSMSMRSRSNNSSHSNN